MSRKRTIDDLLAEADAVSEISIDVTDEERDTIRAYCKLALRCKKTEASAREHLAGTKKTLAELRKDLLSALKDANVEILAIPKTIRMEAEKKGAHTVPPYIRLTKTTKDLTITTDVIEDALRGLSEEDIRGSESQSGLEAIVRAVIEGVRRAVRSFSEHVKLVESVPRGTRAADIDAASPEISAIALQFHDLSNTVEGSEREKREAVGGDKSQMEVQRRIVESYFERAETTHQRVVLDNASYNLCKRTSVIKPKVTTKVLEQIVTDSLILVYKGRKLTREQAASSLGDKKNELLVAVKTALAGLPTSTKTAIHLQKVSEKPESDEEE